MRIEIFVFIIVELLIIFLIVKPDGYQITTQNPMSMDRGTNFYPRV
jgi:hypothetical protein